MRDANHGGMICRVERILDKISAITSSSLISLAVVALVVWAMVIVVYILGRSIFNVGWLFIDEFTIYWVVLVSFFAFPYSVRKGAHIKVDILVKQLPQRVQRILAAGTMLLSLIVVIYLAQKGTYWFLQALETGKSSQYVGNVPLWPVYLFIPIGLAVMGLAILLELYRSVIEVVRGRKKESK